MVPPTNDDVTGSAKPVPPGAAWFRVGTDATAHQPNFRYHLKTARNFFVVFRGTNAGAYLNLCTLLLTWSLIVVWICIWDYLKRLVSNPKFRASFFGKNLYYRIAVFATP